MEDNENNMLSKSTELFKYVASLFTIAAGLFGAVKDIWGLRAYAIIPALLGIGWLGFLIYQAVKRAKQKRRSIQFREEDRPTGFNEALAYTTRDVHRFYGRQNDTFNIMNRIDRDDYRLGVLHGESGVGKTSIIQAGLIPELENRKLQWGYVSLNHLPKAIDSADDLVDFLRRQVGKKFDLSGAANLKDMANQLAAASKTGTVLFLDQFEQVFDRSNEEARQEFSQRLEECCRSVDLFKIVIVVRGDYFGRVYNMFKSMIEPNATSYLAKFNKIQAREVIRKSAGYDENLHITSPDDPLLGFEDDILADLQDSDRRIHPVELSLICSTIMKQNGKLDRAAYLDGGRKQGWLNRYLDDVLKGQPQQASLQLLSGLIDVDKAATLTAKEISERSGLNLPETRGLLNYFLQSRLIVEEGENDEQKYRLAHEYLIASIRLRCGDVETPVQKYHRLLETRVQAWEREDHNPHHLLKGKNLYKVRFQLREHLGWEASLVKRTFVRKSLTRYLAVMLIYSLLIAVSGGLIGYGWHSLNENAKVTNYLTATKSVSLNYAPELIELSREEWDIKLRVLSAVLNEASYSYEYRNLCHVLIGISKENRDKMVEFLCDRMENSNIPLVKSRTASALGAIGNERAADPLIRLLEKSTDSNVQRSAAGALGKIGNAKAIDSLITLLEKSTDSDVQRSAVEALGKIGNEQAVDPLIKLLEKSTGFYVQYSIALALGEIGNEKAVDPLIKLLEKNTDSDVQCNVAEALGEIGNEKAVDPLIKLLEKSTNTYVLISVGEALGKIGNEKAIDPLIRFLEKSMDTYIQCNVLAGLGKIRNEKILDPLIRLLEKSTDSDVQRSVANALRKIGNEKAIDPLIRFLEKSTDSDVQCNVLAALGKIGSEKAIDPLIKLLEKRKYPSVLRSAAWALGEIGPPAKSALSDINRLYEKEKNFLLKYELAWAMLKIDPFNRKYLTMLIEEILPHPLVEWKFNSPESQFGEAYTIKARILKATGEIAGKEAAGENLDFGGDMWKMLDWWKQYKKTPLRPNN